MAAKKAELEQHRDEYDARMIDTRAALKARLYREALTFAISSLNHIDGMMQYERKYENREFDSVESVDLLLKYAPLLLEFEVLDNLEIFLKNQRRIERNTRQSLGDKITAARRRMWQAHSLWNHLEQQSDSRQDSLGRTLGGSQDRWRSLSERWEEMELIDRLPEGGSFRLRLCTRMNEKVVAKCPECGVIANARKAKFLKERNCPKCGNSVSFVILARKSDYVG